MRDRLNKPKVFLSHSSLDKEFINRLATDLRKCQIEPWLDTEEIRDGRPWLSVIFEDGIPSCDAVIIYLTENSLASKMVAKEMDATLVEQLGESGISLLPYVSQAELRGRLRSDIRSLHCREWNHNNYSEVLPSVAAEIWRSFMESNMNAAVAQEKSRRLEMELRVKELNERYADSVFSPQEEREFRFIYDRLNRNVKMKCLLRTIIREPHLSIHEEVDVFSFPLLNSLIHYVNIRGESEFFSEGSYISSVVALLEKEGHPKELNETGAHYAKKSINTKLPLELLTFGFLEKISIYSENEYQYDRYNITNKAYRFMYWLEYNSIDYHDLKFEYEGRRDASKRYSQTI